MDNITPQQKKKLERILKLGKEGLPALLEYLFEIEEKIETEIPTLRTLMKDIKGEKGDSYVITEEDQANIISSVRNLINDAELAKEVLGLIDIDYDRVAKIASAYIEVPEAEKVDYAKINKEVLANIKIPKARDGIDANEENVVFKVVTRLEQNLPSHGDKFRDGLELLPEGERLSIDAVENLRKELDEAKKAGSTHTVIGANRNLYQLLDVDVAGVTTNQVLSWNGTKWVATTPSGGGGTVNTNLTLTGDGSSGDPLSLNLSNANTWTARQDNQSIFVNNSNLDWTTNNVTIAAAGSDGGGEWLGFQWNHTDDRVNLQDESGALFDLQVDTLYANDSIVSSSITSNSLTTGTIAAQSSGGILLESNSGTDVALLGAGGGAGATFYGGVNIAGNLAVDTNVLYVDTSTNRVGINISSPTSDIHLNNSGAVAVNTQYTNSSTGSTSGNGTLVGITSAGVFEINQKENQVMNFYTNNTVGMTINTSQQVLLNTGSATVPTLSFNGDTNTGLYRYAADYVAITTSGTTGFIVGFSNGTPFVSISSTAARIANLAKFNVAGAGSGSDSPIFGIKNTSDDSLGKNGGIFTQTRMTSRYLQTSQNIGQNDNSFGNPGVIQWTAWEYSDNTFTTIATPTEFTGWSYQYYNGSAYKNLLRIHTAGVGIGMLNAASTPAASLQVNGSSVAAGTPGVQDILVLGRNINSGVSFPQAATFALGTYSTNSAGNGFGPDTRLDLNLKASSSDNFTSNVNVMTWLDTGAIGAGVTSPTAIIHLKAGTATASTAPLKFTTGTNLTTAEVGAMEYNNTFHVTNSDATRRHVVTAPNTTKVTAGAPYTNNAYVVVNIGGTDFKVMTTA